MQTLHNFCKIRVNGWGCFLYNTELPASDLKESPLDPSPVSEGFDCIKLTILVATALSELASGFPGHVLKSFVRLSTVTRHNNREIQAIKPEETSWNSSTYKTKQNKKTDKLTVTKAVEKH